MFSAQGKLQVISPEPSSKPQHNLNYHNHYICNKYRNHKNPIHFLWPTQRFSITMGGSWEESTHFTFI